MDWLEIQRGDAPLIVCFPHTGTELPEDVAQAFVSPWLARLDADWWVDRLYGFAAQLGATTVRTGISRSVIDVNRDPSGASLYPGQAMIELFPTTTCDGAPLYATAAPDAAEIARRRARYFDPYHAAIEAEIARLRALHGQVVVYDAHSIRSHVPRLFEGELPHFNIGTNGGATCDPDLARSIEAICAASGYSHVLDGRFRGGWTTRHYGRPAHGVHALQIELAIRGYLHEPATFTPDSWPTPWSAKVAAPISTILAGILHACVDFAKATKGSL
ncbi:N-formylglutamate deformylase [soil metagenome]